MNPALAAAVCLENLKRYDEALDPARRATVESRVAKLRTHVGTITFDGGEPGATVVVDGRYRCAWWRGARAPIMLLA